MTARTSCRKLDNPQSNTQNMPKSYQTNPISSRKQLITFCCSLVFLDEKNLFDEIVPYDLFPFTRKTIFLRRGDVLCAWAFIYLGNEGKTETCLAPATKPQKPPTNKIQFKSP